MSDVPPVPKAIARAISSVEPPDESFRAAAAARQAQLTMPLGSLGRLLELGQQLAAVQRTETPFSRPAMIAVFVADHGIAAEGVSAYPQAVTGQMILNFAQRGAAINAIAASVDIGVQVADLGTIEPPKPPKSYHHQRPIRAGTSNFLHGPAMTRDEAYRAVADGVQLCSGWTGKHGCRLIGLGEMGIANSTSASALIAALTGTPAERVVGRGTGVDDPGLAHKVEVVAQAIELHSPHCRDVWDWAAAVGGFEILGLVGVAIHAARARTVVILDGLISTAAGLIAARLCPAIVGSLVAAHVGTEPGHRVALDALGLTPLLDLGLRLGEGTGAALAVPLLDAAAGILSDMATFNEARVAGPARPSERSP